MKYEAASPHMTESNFAQWLKKIPPAQQLTASQNLHRRHWSTCCNLHCVVVVVVFISRAMAHILNACIVTCTVWWWWWWLF